MQIDVRMNIKQVQRDLDRIQKKQIPFATSVAINETAKDVKRAEEKQLPQKLDRPTPFTLRAFGIKWANKRNLFASVFVKPIQEAYLKWAIHGGTQQHAGRGTGVPTKHKQLNRYGNIPGRKTGLVKGKRQFIATIRGVSGIWERRGKGGRDLRLMVRFAKVARFKPGVFPFYRIGQEVVRSRFDQQFRKALAKALRTAR